jgi:hypothetical protein
MPCNYRSVALMMLALSLPLSAYDLSHTECVKAARSDDGRFLVVSDTQFEPSKQFPGAHTVTQITYGIFSQQEFIYPGADKLTSPMTFWADSPPLWTVVLGHDKAVFCPIPLILGSQYLVLLDERRDFYPGWVVMRIYKEPSRTGPASEWGKGVLVKELTLAELRPGHKLSNGPYTNAGTPMWFAGGTFQWGRDNHSLLYKSATGEFVSIDLNTGSITDCTKQSVYGCTGY